LTRYRWKPFRRE